MRVEMYETEKQVSVSEIEKAIKKMGVKVSQEYMDFMTDQNGGNPKVCNFTLPDGTDSSVVNVFYPIGDMEGNLERKNFIFDGEIPEGFITVGNDSGGNQILLGVNDKVWGQIYFWDHEADSDESMHFLANSLNEFLNMLE